MTPADLILKLFKFVPRAISALVGTALGALAVLLCAKYAPDYGIDPKLCNKENIIMILGFALGALSSELLIWLMAPLVRRINDYTSLIQMTVMQKLLGRYLTPKDRKEMVKKKLNDMFLGYRKKGK